MDVAMEDGMTLSEHILPNLKKIKLKERFYSIKQTTAGIRKFEKSELSYPVINVAESELKMCVENKISAPESIPSSFLSKVDISLSGKRVLILGYGPGVGKYTAPVMSSGIGDIDRFTNSHKLCSYAGIVPSVRNPANTVHHGRITKRGSNMMRWSLI